MMNKLYIYLILTIFMVSFVNARSITFSVSNRTARASTLHDYEFFLGFFSKKLKLDFTGKHENGMYYNEQSVNFNQRIYNNTTFKLDNINDPEHALNILGLTLSRRIFKYFNFGLNSILLRKSFKISEKLKFVSNFKILISNIGVVYFSKIELEYAL